MRAVTLLRFVKAGADCFKVRIAVKLDDVFAFKRLMRGIKPRIHDADANARSGKALRIGSGGTNSVQIGIAGGFGADRQWAQDGANCHKDASVFESQMRHDAPSKTTETRIKRLSNQAQSMSKKCCLEQIVRSNGYPRRLCEGKRQDNRSLLESKEAMRRTELTKKTVGAQIEEM